MVLIEKYKKPDYTDEKGYKTWTDRYGDVIKQEDAEGRQVVNVSIDIPMNTLNLIDIHGADFQFEFENIIMKKLLEELALKNIDINDVDISGCSCDIIMGQTQANVRLI
jgi:hypothetical protein